MWQEQVLQSKLIHKPWKQLDNYQGEGLQLGISVGV